MSIPKKLGLVGPRGDVVTPVTSAFAQDAAGGSNCSTCKT